MIQERESSGEKRQKLDPPITQLLEAWTGGDKSALDQALPLFHENLRHIARQQLKHENAQGTLSTTILVNELYLELISTKQISFDNRYQFFSFVAAVMRHLLVRHARRRNASKRGGGFYLESFKEEKGYETQKRLDPEDILALGEALGTLEKMDPRQTRVVELRFFAGLTQEEIAETLDLSRSTVKRDLRTANLWLSAHLKTLDALNEEVYEAVKA